MIKRNWALILFLHIIFLTFLHAQIFDGFILFSTYNNTQNSSLLISNNQNIIHTWEHENGPASMPYLMPDSSIIQFTLASLIVVSSPGEPSFNKEVSTMTWVSYIAVLLPTMLIVGKGYLGLISGIEKVSSLKKEEFLKS